MRQSLAILALSFFLALFFLLPAAYSQKTVVDDAVWATYFGQFKLSEKWGIHMDAQFRADGQIGRVNQNLLRTGLQYYLHKNANLTLGYAHIATYSEGLERYVPERRLWQQLILSNRLGPAQMTNRFRLEQRFVRKYAADGSGNFQADGNNYGNRIRYFHRSIFNLSKEKKNIPYVAVQEEIFFNFGADAINPNFFDQNRFLLAFGVLHQQHTRLEIGYMNQLVNPAKGANLSNNIVHLSILQTLNFSL